jgi:hypothetical protein
VFQRTGKKLPGAGEFSDHTKADKTSCPLVFRQDEKADGEDQNHEGETKDDLSQEMVTELEEEGGVRRHTSLFDLWFAHDSGLIKHVESHGKDWIGPLRSNRQVTYANKEMRWKGASTRKNAKSMRKRTKSGRRHCRCRSEVKFGW